MQDLVVMINGLRGKMGQEIAKVILTAGIEVFPLSLTSSQEKTFRIIVDEKSQDIELIQYTSDLSKSAMEKVHNHILDNVRELQKTLIVIDFTHPTAVQINWEIYCKLRLPFVFGTTGCDHEQLAKETIEKDTYAVIAPNMCKEIVAFQYMLRKTANEFPGCFKSYNIEITESHQKTKADTSGTAKAVLGYLNKLTDSNMSLEQVNKIRTESEQLDFGVPSNALSGHAFHTYTLQKKDRSAEFQFKHNFCGRTSYAEGVRDAVLFLKRKIDTASQKKVFDMIDVLQEGV